MGSIGGKNVTADWLVHVVAVVGRVGEAAIGRGVWVVGYSLQLFVAADGRYLCSARIDLVGNGVTRALANRVLQCVPGKDRHAHADYVLRE